MARAWNKRPKKNPGWYRKKGDKWVLTPGAQKALRARAQRDRASGAARNKRVEQIRKKREEEASFLGPGQVDYNKWDDPVDYKITKRGPKVGGYVVSANGKPVWQGQQKPNIEGLKDQLLRAQGLDPNDPYRSYPKYARETAHRYDTDRDLHQAYGKDVQQWLTSTLGNINNAQRQSNANYEQRQSMLPNISQVVTTPSAQVAGGGGAAVNRADVASIAATGQASVENAQGQANIDRYLADSEVTSRDSAANFGMAETLAQIPSQYNKAKQDYLNNINQFLMELEASQAQAAQDYQLEIAKEEGVNQRHAMDVAQRSTNDYYDLIGSITGAGVRAQGQEFDRQIALAELERSGQEVDGDVTQFGTGANGKNPPKIKGYDWSPVPGRPGYWSGIKKDGGDGPQRGTGGVFIPGNAKPEPVKGLKWIKEPGGWRGIKVGSSGPGGGGGGDKPLSRSQRLSVKKYADSMWDGGTQIDPDTGKPFTSGGSTRSVRGIRYQKKPVELRVEALMNNVTAAIGSSDKNYTFKTAEDIVSKVVGSKAFNKYKAFVRWKSRSKKYRARNPWKRGPATPPDSPNP